MRSPTYLFLLTASLFASQAFSSARVYHRQPFLHRRGIGNSKDSSASDSQALLQTEESRAPEKSGKRSMPTSWFKFPKPLALPVTTESEAFEGPPGDPFQTVKKGLPGRAFWNNRLKNFGDEMKESKQRLKWADRVLENAFRKAKEKGGNVNPGIEKSVEDFNQKFTDFALDKRTQKLEAALREIVTHYTDNPEPPKEWTFEKFRRNSILWVQKVQRMHSALALYPNTVCLRACAPISLQMPHEIASEALLSASEGSNGMEVDQSDVVKFELDKKVENGLAEKYQIVMEKRMHNEINDWIII